MKSALVRLRVDHKCFGQAEGISVQTLRLISGRKSNLPAFFYYFTYEVKDLNCRTGQPD
jgi:hypothetical protein